MSIGATNNTHTSAAPVSGTNSPSYHGNNVKNRLEELTKGNVFSYAAAHPPVQAGAYNS